MNKSKVLILIICIFCIGWFWQSPIKNKTAEANRLYNEGKIDEALSKYRDAQIENPDSPQLHYNIGSALHQKKNYEDALNEFDKAINSKDVELQARAYYNLGNTHYRTGKLLEAIEDYKKCLDINPDDEDAKYNIEFIRKKIKEQLKKEEQEQTHAQQEAPQKTQQIQQQAQQQAQQQEGQAHSQEKAQEEQKQAKEEVAQEEKPGEEKKEETQEQKPEGLAQEEKEAKEKPKEGEMSREDAMRILDAMKDDEKDLQKELRRQPIEGEYRVEKDW